MKTQTFKAKDVKSAINMVNDQYGEKAIILSTKKNNGLMIFGKKSLPPFDGKYEL